MGIESAIPLITGIASLGERLFSAKSDAEKQSLLLEFQRAIIAAQGETMSLQNQLASAHRELERLQKELQLRNEWAVEKEKYELAQVASGIFCWIVKGARDTEPELIQKYCSNCMEYGKRPTSTPLRS